MLEENIKKVRAEIEACRAKFNIKNEVYIVAATKNVAAATVNRLSGLGISTAGENKVQELLTKLDEVVGVEWHFIGRLQSNKVKYIIDKVSLIQSVDRISLLEQIDKECTKRGIIANILIEVNIANELSKGGIAPDKVVELVKIIGTMPHIAAQGLMCVAPIETEPEKNRKYYLQMAELYDNINTKIAHGCFKYLSMGMSGDYLKAIECGANMVRIGTALFGSRYN
jgi:pyridoxal phosphate enzyme (YggS family)